MRIAALSQAQAVALLRKHLTGDFGEHDWRTISWLIRAGYLAEVDRNLVVTPKGKEWCDKNHLRVSLVS